MPTPLHRCSTASVLAKLIRRNPAHVPATHPNLDQITALARVSSFCETRAQTTAIDDMAAHSTGDETCVQTRRAPVRFNRKLPRVHWPTRCVGVCGCGCDSDSGCGCDSDSGCGCSCGCGCGCDCDCGCDYDCGCRVAVAVCVCVCVVRCMDDSPNAVPSYDDVHLPRAVHARDNWPAVRELVSQFFMHSYGLVAGATSGRLLATATTVLTPVDRRKEGAGMHHFMSQEAQHAGKDVAASAVKSVPTRLPPKLRVRVQRSMSLLSQFREEFCNFPLIRDTLRRNTKTRC